MERACTVVPRNVGHEWLTWNPRQCPETRRSRSACIRNSNRRAAGAGTRTSEGQSSDAKVPGVRGQHGEQTPSLSTSDLCPGSPSGPGSTKLYGSITAWGSNLSFSAWCCGTSLPLTIVHQAPPPHCSLARKGSGSALWITRSGRNPPLPQQAPWAPRVRRAPWTCLAAPAPGLPAASAPTGGHLRTSPHLPFVLSCS
ncbi:transcription elongation factor SPT5-like isoform X2 [Suricata suricatta]|uniref:transcription elongation factor SPT5-like isoform X2 n=1 Tax=Suricata suricatta TaxID=37032 RepID=UPI001155EBD6|nr:transcription elongation factor SPT5-like isoform X2 [Suricata suricatta]